MTPEHLSVYEAEALAAAERAANHVRAADSALDAAANALLRGSAAGYRDLEKVRELHRLFGVRLSVFVRRLGEGALSDARNEVTP